MLKKEDYLMVQEMIERGMYLKDIAYELGVHPRTIRRALKRGAAPKGRRPSRASKLDAFKGKVDALLSEGVWNAVVIWREIEAAGYAGSAATLRRYIYPKRTLRAASSRTTVRFETAPGEQLQHDWAETVTLVGGVRRKVFFAINTLGYSRRFHFWATDSQDAEHTYESASVWSATTSGPTSRRRSRAAPPSVSPWLFFFDCPYPGIGRRWVDADHLGEIWYQSFNQQPWAAAFVGASREACKTYIGHFLRHWAHDPHAFDDDLDEWVENFLKPGNLQGGFNWYIVAHAARMALIRDGAPRLPKIAVPTRVLWGESDKILKIAWADRLSDYFSNYDFTPAPQAGHFVPFEQPELANREIAKFFKSLM